MLFSSMRRRKQNKVGFEMTSMIDIVFLLLIFFMCATKFRAPEGALRAFLPKEEGVDAIPPAQSPSCRIQLRQGAKGETTVSIDTVRVPNSRQLRVGEYEYHYLKPGQRGFDRSALLTHLTARQQNYVGLAATLPVTIDFDGNVPWKYVVEVLDVCKDANVEELNIAIPELNVE